MFDAQINYKGETWHYIFSNPDGVLTHEDRETLLWGAIDVYRRNKRRVSVKGHNFEGELTDTREEARVGCFWGRQIKGFVESDKGRRDVGIILWRYANPSFN